MPTCARSRASAPGRRCGAERSADPSCSAKTGSLAVDVLTGQKTASTSTARQPAHRRHHATGRRGAERFWHTGGFTLACLGGGRSTRRASTPAVHVVTSALVWGAVTKPPTIAGVLGYNFVFLTLLATTAAANRIRDVLPGRASGSPSRSCSSSLLGWAGLLQLPRPDLPSPAVLPGATVLALGLQAMHLVSVFYLPHTIDEPPRRRTGRSGSGRHAPVAVLYGRLVVSAACSMPPLWSRYNEAGDARDLVGAGRRPGHGRRPRRPRRSTRPCTRRKERKASSASR